MTDKETQDAVVDCLTLEFCEKLTNHYIKKGSKVYPVPVIGGHPEKHHITTADVMAAQQGIITELKEELERTRQIAIKASERLIDAYGVHIVTDESEELKAEVESLRDVLRFYADDATYEGSASPIARQVAPITSDLGQRARLALINEALQ